MRIWIDFINTPQVSFFLPFIKDFYLHHHEVLLTCRDSGSTVSLLRKNGLDFHVVGKKVKKGTLGKIFLFPRRVFDLWRYVRKMRPDVAIGQSSFYLPVVARLMRIPSLYTNDNEHARGNIFGFLFAKKVFLPAVLKKKRFIKFWPLKNKVVFYPSIKEAIYLSQWTQRSTILSESPKVIYFRPEPNSAQYYRGPKYFFEDMLIELSREYHVVVLARNSEQAAYYRQWESDRLQVPDYPVDLNQIVANCLLFIGAGGTMNRELAVLGVKVLSVYQSDQLAVDRYLIEAGRMVFHPSITMDGIRKIIHDKPTGKDLGQLKEGENSYRIILDQIAQMHDA